jgi:hypothetical protein
MTGTTAPDGATVATMRVIWVALSASIGVYVAVLFVLGAQLAGREPGEIMELVFYAQSVLLAAGSLAYRRWALSDERLRQAMAGAEGEAAKSDALLAELNVTTIVGLALHEAIALFGFVLGFLAGDPLLILPFAAVALVLNAMIFPRPEPLLARVRSLSLTPAALI